MAKYHINKNGAPAVCRALIRPCPLGGKEVHFSTEQEAQAHADKMNSANFGLLSGITQERQTENIEDSILKDDMLNGTKSVFEKMDHMYGIYLDYMEDAVPTYNGGSYDLPKDKLELVKLINYNERPRGYEEKFKKHPYLKYEGIRYATQGMLSEIVTTSDGKMFTPMVTHKDKNGNEMLGLMTNDGEHILPGIVREDYTNFKHVIKGVDFSKDVIQLPIHVEEDKVLYAYVDLKTGKMTDATYDNEQEGPVKFNPLTNEDENVLDVLENSTASVKDFYKHIHSSFLPKNDIFED